MSFNLLQKSPTIFSTTSPVYSPVYAPVSTNSVFGLFKQTNTIGNTTITTSPVMTFSQFSPASPTVFYQSQPSYVSQTIVPYSQPLYSTTVLPYPRIGYVPYGVPVISTINTEVTANSDTQEKMVKYFYYKLLDKWLYNDLKDLLGYLTIENDSVKLIKTLESFDVKSALADVNSIVEKKGDYIGKYILNLSNVYKIIREFIAETKTNWFDLTKHEFIIKQHVRESLEKRLKGAVLENK